MSSTCATATQCGGKRGPGGRLQLQEFLEFASMQPPPSRVFGGGAHLSCDPYCGKFSESGKCLGVPPG